MNPTEQAIKTLRNDVKGLLEDATLSDHQFVSHLAKLASRGQQALHPRQVDFPNLQRDILKEFSRFQTNQAVVDFAHKHKLTLQRGSFWWTINADERPGYIEGLENESIGVPRITNGIDVWIERADGTLFLGHRDWLKYRRKPAVRSASGANKPTLQNGKSGTKPTARDVDVATKLIDQDAVGMFAQRYEQVVGKPLAFVPAEVKKVDIANVGDFEDTFEKDVAALAAYVHEHFEKLHERELEL